MRARAAALVAWPREGIPTSPAAWLLTVGRRRAVDTYRRRVALDELVVDGVGGAQLEHHAIGRERQRAHGQQERARDVDVRRAPTHQALQADVRDRLREHARGRLVRVCRRRREQLEANDLLDVIEDRLTRDDDRGDRRHAVV